MIDAAICTNSSAERLSFLVRHTPNFDLEPESILGYVFVILRRTALRHYVMAI